MPCILTTTSSFDLDHIPQRDELARQGVALRVNPYGRRLTEAEVAELLADAEVIGLLAGAEPLTERVLRAAPGLRAIARVGTGTENVALDAAKQLGISVSNTPDAPTQSVAELAVALMVDAVRGITSADRQVRAGRWTAPAGCLLQSKTVGLIGLGRIGRRVAEMLKPFGCRIVSSDPMIAAHQVPEGVEMLDLDALLTQSDVVSLHLPVTQDTVNYLNAERLALLPDGAIVVNTARGSLVDEVALLHELRQGRLAGAALDCFVEEPYEGPFIEMENVVVTPHIGGRALETRTRMEQEAAANLLRDLRACGVI